MQKLLFIEDSPIVLKILKHLAQDINDFEVIFASSKSSAEQLIKQHGSLIYAALADLNLPDAPDGEVVDSCLAANIPTIVLTGRMDTKTQEALISKGVLDYVHKDNRFSYQYAIKAIRNLKENQKTKVLIAEDSKLVRNYISQILKAHMYQVFEAEDGAKALEIFEKNPDINLLLTDFNMPIMDGFELIRTIRSAHKNRHLAILGLSSLDSENISVQFIKSGADDYLPKPFKLEEFNCRVDRILETHRLVIQLEKLAHQDPLTGLGNRRHFFQEGRKLFDQAQNSGKEIFAAVMDIDHFKQINDTYGHDVGDKVLVHFAQKIQESFSRFITARAGGEEFFVLLKGLPEDKAYALLDGFRQSIEQDIIFHEEHQLSVTVSIGMTNELGNSLEEFMHHADTLLYEAKQTGRNMVVSG